MDAIKQESAMSRELEVQKLQKEWDTNPRWKGIKRGYTAEDVVRLRGSLPSMTTAWFSRRNSASPPG